MFSKPRIKSLLQQYTLVQLYTDRVPPHFQKYTTEKENLRLLQERFGTAQLPTYIILDPRGDPQGKEIGRYIEGKINDVDGFARFLEQGLAKNEAAGRTQARRD